MTAPGGMATVYLATDLKHDRDVAIKVLHPELGAALGSERFLSEIKTTAKLQHPHILPLLDSGEADGQNLGHGRVAGRSGRFGFGISGGVRDASEYTAPAGTFGKLTLAKPQTVRDVGVRDRNLATRLTSDVESGPAAFDRLRDALSNGPMTRLFVRSGASVIPITWPGGVVRSAGRLRPVSSDSSDPHRQPGFRVCVPARKQRPGRRAHQWHSPGREPESVPRTEGSPQGMRGRPQSIVITTLPRACPASRYAIAARTSFNG